MRTLHRILCLLSLAAVMPAQCCAGAQDQTVDSPGKRYRVEARSLAGTGPGAHGPYRFRFRTLRVGEDGALTELGAFERTWDCRVHFSMALSVSPTGNGFLLSSSLEPGVRLFAPDGTVLREVACRAPHALRPQVAAPSPLQIQLYSSSRPVEVRKAWLWLPLCHVVGPEQRRGPGRQGKWSAVADDLRWPRPDDGEIRWLLSMLTWSPARGEEQREQVMRWLPLLRQPAQREAAAAALLELGLSARPALRAAAVDDGELAAIIGPILAAMRARLCGHDEPWRHRELLQALLTHPDERLVAAARGRLRALAAK